MIRPGRTPVANTDGKPRASGDNPDQVKLEKNKLP